MRFRVTKRIWRHLVAWCVLLAAVVAGAPPAAAVVVRLPGGRFAGVMPHRGVDPASIPGSIAAQTGAAIASDSGNLDYHGGPVIHSSAPYLIFWTPAGESVPSGSESLMQRYFSDVAADSGKATNAYAVDRQYTDNSGFADYRQTFSASSQTIVDTHAYPPPDSTNCPDVDPSFYPRCITDSQIQTELARLIGARGLPTGISGSAPLYFVVTPSDVDVCLDSEECADNAFCAYHSAFTDNGNDVLYAATPYFLSANSADHAQYAKGCQQDSAPGVIQEPNSDLADVALSYLSHEQSESLTDPLGTGWWDGTSGNEGADNCIQYGPFDPSGGSNPDAYQPALGGDSSAGTLYDQLIGDQPYYLQAEWSDGNVDCEMRPSSGTLVPIFGVPPPGSTPVGAPVTFDPGTTTSSAPASSATWDFGDGTAPRFESGDLALAPVSHAFASAGRHTITLTLVDDLGNLATGSEQVVVGSPPSPLFTASPARPLVLGAVHFKATGSSDPDAGVTIASYAWSFGDGGSDSGTNPRHVYRRAGTYTVTLTVTSALGLTATTLHRVTVLHPIARITVRKIRNGATVLVTVNGPGRVSLGHKTIRRHRPGTARFKLALVAAQRNTLARTHKLKLRLRVRFAPSNGASSTRIVTIKFGR
jgi:PKD domain